MHRTEPVSLRRCTGCTSGAPMRRRPGSLRRLNCHQSPPRESSWRRAASPIAARRSARVAWPANTSRVGLGSTPRWLLTRPRFATAWSAFAVSPRRRGDNSRGGLPTYRVDKVKHERCGLSQGSIGSPRKDNRASSKDLDPQGFVAVNFPLTSGGTPAIHNPEHTPLEIIHSKRAEINTRSTGLIL